MTDTDRSSRPSTVEAAFLMYERAIRRVISRIVQAHEDIDDLAQESFLRALAAERQRPIENPKAYLFETARNTALNEATRKSRRLLQIIEESAALAVPSSAPLADEEMIGRQKFSIFCEAVATLPPQCRKVFLMCKVYGQPHREIALSLGISQSTVEKHVAAGLARCSAYIRARDDGDSAVTPLMPTENGRLS